MTDVEISEIQADVREELPQTPETQQTQTPLPDIKKAIRETIERESWRLARISAE